MKRSLFLVPFVLLFLLNSCDPGIGPEIETAVAQTQIARTWTPTIIPLPDPDEKTIVYWLNDELSKANSLEMAMDAEFHVRDVTVSTDTSGESIVRVYAQCVCSKYGGCCSSERIFVKILEAMRVKQVEILNQIPPAVKRMEVICYEQMTPLPTMGVSWSDVKEYFSDKINADQFGHRVSRK